MIPHALPSIADQVRSAAACAAESRSQSVRAIVSARSTAAAQRMNRQRLALLQRMARTDDLTTRQLYERVAAEIDTTEGSLHHILYDLRDRGWAASHVPASRKGIRVGTGRVNSWRITTLGRVALVELAGATGSNDTDAYAEDDDTEDHATRTGAH